MATDQTEAGRLAAVHNERIKLRAAYLSGLAIAVFAVGGFAPVISYLGTSLTAAHHGVVSGLGLGCVLTGWLIHRVAQRGLGDMTT